MMKRFRVFALSLATVVIGQTFVLVGASRPVMAQYMNPFTGGMWNNPISSSADTIILNNVFKRMLTPKATQSASSPTPAPTSAPAKTYALTASSFKPVAPSLIPQQFATDQARSAAERQELLQLYSELLQSYDALLEDNGEQHLKNNVAGAMMYLVSANRYVLSDGEEMSKAEQAELLQSVNAGLAEDAQFQSLSAQKKQSLYETLVISGSLPLALYLQGHEQGDAQLVQQGQDMAEEILRDMVGLLQ